MPGQSKHNIWIHLADVKPIALNVSSDEEPLYREAERLVNSLWEKWMRMFNESGSSQEVLARVCFQFARLYLAAYNDNKQLANFLSDFERQLDEIVVAVD